MALELTEEQRTRLWRSEDYWLATVRPGPGAHLVPIWAVFVEESQCLYMATGREAQKVRNLLAHPRVALALPDTRRVLVLEGSARLVTGEPPAVVMELFQAKYNWSFDPNEPESTLLEFVPDKILSWNS